MAGKKRKSPSVLRSPLATRIREQRVGAEKEVSLDRLEADLADVSRYDLVASLKELEKAGHGQFLVGRKGKRSRFVWADKPEKAGERASAEPVDAPSSAVEATEPAAAKGLARKVLVPVGRRLERPRLSSPERSADSEPARLSGRGRSLQHAFHLRPGLQVALELPEDVTGTEIERLCTFLKAIPFAGSGRS